MCVGGRMRHTHTHMPAGETPAHDGTDGKCSDVGEGEGQHAARDEPVPLGVPAESEGQNGDAEPHSRAPKALRRRPHALHL